MLPTEEIPLNRKQMIADVSIVQSKQSNWFFVRPIGIVEVRNTTLMLSLLSLK
jgi:hypothetical protein